MSLVVKDTFIEQKHSLEHILALMWSYQVYCHYIINHNKQTKEQCKVFTKFLVLAYWRIASRDIPHLVLHILFLSVDQSGLQTLERFSKRDKMIGPISTKGREFQFMMDKECVQTRSLYHFKTMAAAKETVEMNR